MGHEREQPVIVVGAGLAGLAAAGFLRRQGLPVVLYEAGKQIAGLAQSFHDDDGFTYDFGAHFITNRLAAAVGITQSCRDVPRYRETVWLDGRSYGYPFGLMRVPRYSASALRSRLRRGPEAPSAADWLRARYGRAFADEIAVPLVQAWSGVDAQRLSPAAVGGIPQSIARILWLKLASRLTGRAVGCGYSRELPEKPTVWHVYPQGGIGTLCQKLAEDLTGLIRLESPVEQILVERGRAVGVRVNGREHEAAAVVSTAPVHVLAKLVPEGLEHLARFRYRPMVFVNLRLLGRHVLPDVVTWTPERRFPFFRLTETPLSMPWLAPEGKTIVTVDIGCEVGDATWRTEDQALGELCVEQLQAIVPDARRRYLGCRVLRTPIAYPILLRDYEADRLRFEQGTGVQGLHSVGRAGEFKHIFMEDVYWRTLRKMRSVVAEVQATPPGARGRD